MIERLPPVTIVTPCTGICAIGDDDLCRGCARTLDEIAAWGTMTPDQRDDVMAALPRRQADLSARSQSN